MPKRTSRLQQDNTICFRCGAYMTSSEKHHILNGPYRSKCEEDRLFCYVHSYCHRLIHSNPESARKYKMKAQMKYEEEIGTRDEFIERYGKSYL